MPSPSIKNDKQYESLRDKGMSKARAARIANSPDASKHGGQKSGSGGNLRSRASVVEWAASSSCEDAVGMGVAAVSCKSSDLT